MHGLPPRRLYGDVFRLLSEPGSQPVTVRDVARVSQLRPGIITHWFGDMETLYRLAVADRIAALAARLGWSPEPDQPVGCVIAKHARICADLFAGEDYRRLLYLVVRDGASFPWLAKKHESAILEAMRDSLARVVGRARAPSGMRLEIRASATRAFVARLQGELALPMLLPGQKPPTHMKVRQAIEQVTAEAVGAVYSSGLVIAALEQFAARRTPPMPPPVPAPAGDWRIAAGL
ncbi:MAG TPA: TetR/AcrR family transcriptional regulator C-terminal domain-containing protein [Allosphingosinicella sp.]|jgi:AcrR family transcriptional regulator|nr:TetR/AcrR family transcriptional regulator C-terminal domain-containing protein [Allosphingosinicella sp.]